MHDRVLLMLLVQCVQRVLLPRVPGAAVDGVSDFFHQMIVEIQIVKRAES